MTGVLNPVRMTEEIRQIMTEKSRLAVALTEADREVTEAKRVYEQAKARAYLRAEGSIKDKEAQAEEATTVERERFDVAAVAFRYANTRLRDKRDDLSAMQTLSKDVRQAYGATSWEAGA